jgi:secreted PhoX family phosphatase
LLGYILSGTGLVIGGAWGLGGTRSAGSEQAKSSGRVLGPPDANGIRLPPGFTSRIVARSGERPVAGASYLWHALPDGGATFATEDGGWLYVSNSEVDGGGGGAGALRFDREARVVDAYSICSGTSRNCAGGVTPWGTWLTCEEILQGRVWECDPLGKSPAVVRPALGTFTHEAVAVDPSSGFVYLTEDTSDGRWYRFRPAAGATGRSSLDTGVLEVAQVLPGAPAKVVWHPLSDPLRAAEQAPASTPFDGGEGICLHAGIVYFATKGDNRIWAYDTRAETLRILYDDDAYATPVLTGVDNVTVSPTGDVLVGEDEGDMQLVALTRSGGVEPILQVTGHPVSEIAGPAFDPSNTRLYFSSQRGPGIGLAGVTYEIRGPFTTG